MKTLLSILTFLAISAAYSQTIPPPYINYQATLYDVNGPNPNEPFDNENFPAFINITNELGVLIYKEEHFASTDPNGLVTIKMGDGLYVAGTVTIFNNIPWTVNKYYLTVDFVINGVTSSTAPEQLVTVPYAFHAGTAGNGISSVADNGNGSITFTYVDGSTYTSPVLTGLTGPQGPTGPAGPQGSAGANGQSAYDLWLAQGNTGTVTDYLNQSAYNIWLSQGNTGTQQQFLNSLVGAQGPIGPTGPQGPIGLTGPAGATGATGPQGPAGPQGVPGATGAQGPAGSYIAGSGIQIINDTISTYSSVSFDPTLNSVRFGYDNSGVWVCPSGINQITVELWGAGGSNGTGSTICDPYSLNSCIGYSGGKGGYNKQLVQVIPGNSYTVLVGAIGGGGQQACRAPNGGQSTFNSQIFAPGGQGGKTGQNCCNCSASPLVGANGSITNFTHPSAQLVVPTSYIPQSYVTNVYPQSGAPAGTKGFVVISY
jgi:hypothetical protein